MKKTLENLLLNVIDLASAAFQEDASDEQKHQAASALRGLAAMIYGDGGDEKMTASTVSTSTVTSSATPTEPTATATAKNETESKSTSDPARPDFFSMLLEKLAPMLPQDAVAEAVEAARAEGFRMPIVS